jgi:hypothetical protein
VSGDLTAVKAKRPSRHTPKPLPKLRRRLAEGGKDARVERRPIPHGKGKRGEQSPATGAAPTGPEGGDQRIDFSTYTPLGTPANGGPIPPDPSGADGSLGVVLYTGNSYLMSSTDGGATFSEHDTTTFLPAAQGRPVDQVMIYVPHRRLFAWMMQHGSTPASGDGNFRLAVAAASDLARDIESAWTVYDFTSSDLGLPGVATDRQDLAFSESRLYLTTNLSGTGRVVMTLDLEDLAQKRAVSWAYTDPFDGIFQFSDLSQQNGSGVHSVAIVDTATLRVMALDDGSGTYAFHDVAVAKFPSATDLVSKDPDGVDWLTRGVANVSASVVHGGDLWVAWDAAASAGSDRPVYPNAHVRLARIDRSTWKTSEEHQVWNPGYAFAYGCLAIGPKGDVGYGVAVGGSSDYPNSCFGILGDLVVYFRDSSTATPGAGSEPRFGDYLTVRPSVADARRFSAFGYYVKKSGGGASQRPFYLSYGRP